MVSFYECRQLNLKAIHREIMLNLFTASSLLQPRTTYSMLYVAKASSSYICLSAFATSSPYVLFR